MSKPASVSTPSRPGPRRIHIHWDANEAAFIRIWIAVSSCIETTFYIIISIIPMTTRTCMTIDHDHGLWFMIFIFIIEMKLSILPAGYISAGVDRKRKRFVRIYLWSGRKTALYDETNIQRILLVYPPILIIVYDGPRLQQYCRPIVPTKTASGIVLQQRNLMK